MSEIKWEITLKRCDFCDKTESVLVGFFDADKQKNKPVKITQCGHCTKHICEEHKRYIEISFLGFAEYGSLKMNLCPVCEPIFKEQWVRLIKDFGVALLKGPLGQIADAIMTEAPE